MLAQESMLVQEAMLAQKAMLAEAIKTKTSDIHIEPYEKRFRVRFRIDGVLH